MKKISVIGLGYVGAVSAGCLASKDYEVLGVDVNPLKVELLESANLPSWSRDSMNSLPQRIKHDACMRQTTLRKRFRKPIFHLSAWELLVCATDAWT